jgi:hypothetical protein
MRVLLPVGVDATIKTYCKGAPFYNAFLRRYPVQVGEVDNFRVRRNTGTTRFFIGQT